MNMMCCMYLSVSLRFPCVDFFFNSIRLISLTLK